MAIDRETQVLTDAYASGIRDPRQLANFMAQVTHESNGLNRLEESFRYTRNIQQIPAQAAWRDGADALESARRHALQGKPERLAELMYGGRNGNDEPGDGWKYHGRGYIPLTGKDNYRAAGEALKLDLVNHPDLAQDPANASRIASWYWANRVPEAARDDVKAATLAINGKYNGLEDREQRFAAWQKRLTPEVMQRLAASETQAAAPSVDRALLEQARTGVRAIDAGMGRAPDQASENLSAALAAQAKTHGLTRIDHVVLSDDGQRAFAVQGDMASPSKMVAEVRTAEAVVTPVRQSEATMAAARPTAAPDEPKPPHDPNLAR